MVGRKGREADLEDGNPAGHPGSGGGKLHLETVPCRDGTKRVCVEVRPEISGLESAGDGTVCEIKKPWEKLYGNGS